MQDLEVECSSHLCLRGWAGTFAVCGRRCGYGAAVGPATAIPSLGSSCSFSHSWARCVFSCVTKAASELPLQVIHFLRLEAVRTGRGSSASSWAPAHPCSPSPHFLSIFPSPRISSSTTRHEDNLPETVPAAILEQGQSPVMNPTYR